MLVNQSRIDELFPEEVILFNQSGQPYYVSPAASEMISHDSENSEMFNEVIKIVDMVSSLKLKLSYVVQLRFSPKNAVINCNVSQFGFGYKVMLHANEINLPLNVETAADSYQVRKLHCV